MAPFGNLGDAAPRRGFMPLPLIGRPLKVTAPLVGDRTPKMVSSVVDLPAPFGPTMHTISPSSTETVTPLSAGTRP